VPFKKNRLSGLASWWQTYNKKFHILTILDSAHISKATMLKFDAKGGPGTPSIAPNFVIIAQGDSSLRGKILQKMEIFAILSYLKSSTHISIPIMLKFCQGLKYLKMSTIHTERDDGGAEGPERGTEARSAGVPRGLGLGGAP